MPSLNEKTPVRQVINQCLDELPEERLDFVAELLVYLVDDENAT